MKRIIVPVSLALAQLVVLSAFAAGPGEATPGEDKAVPTKKATAEEKAAAKAARKAEGTAKVKNPGVRDDKDFAAKAKVATKEERKQAAKVRKASATEAVKKGEIPSGEK